MDLVRDVLDEQLVDGRGRNIGKVDGIVIELRSDGPPRVVAIEIGGGTAAERLPRVFRHVARALSRALLPRGRRTRRIPWSRLHFGARDIRVDAAR